MPGPTRFPIPSTTARRSPAEHWDAWHLERAGRATGDHELAELAANGAEEGFERHLAICDAAHAVAPGIDLALLKLDDERVFDTHGPLARALALPDIKDAVMAYGYPTGGSNLAITKGIVSRIEFAAYNRPVWGMRIQIDAAINHGNSGGPAVAGDKMIGLAFSSLGGTQNIGYIIPNEEIELFLADVADGTYGGKPGMYDDLQTLENPALRAFLRGCPRGKGRNNSAKCQAARHGTYHT